MADEKDGNRPISELDESTKQSVNDLGAQLREAGAERTSDANEITPPTSTPANLQPQPEPQNERFRGRGMDDGPQKGESVGKQEINARTEAASWSSEKENTVSTDMDNITQKAEEYIAMQKEAKEQASSEKQNMDSKETPKQDSEANPDKLINEAYEHAKDESSEDKNVDKTSDQRDSEPEK